MSKLKTLTRYDILAAITFWSLILLLFLFFNKMARLEPIEGDCWFVIGWFNGSTSTVETIINALRHYHNNGNPRIGYLFLLLTLHPWPIHQVMTPTVIVLLFVTMFTVALGRRPRPTKARDTYLLILLVALCWLVTPHVGQTFFYRPFTTNYVYGFLCTIAFFVPFRLFLASSFGSGRFWWLLAIVMPLWGLFVGKCNEHTGPTAILVSVGFTAFALTKKQIKPFVWMCAGSIGLISGYLILFFAPGQGKRYDGRGKQSLINTLTERGWTGNLEAIWGFVKNMDIIFIFLCMLLLASALLADDKHRLPSTDRKVRYLEVAAFTFFSLSVAITSLVAPLGFTRLTIASAFLLLMAALIVVDIFSVDWKLMTVIGVLAIVVHVSFAYKSITLYTDINRLFRERVALLKNASGPRGKVVLKPYPYKRTPMYYGDTFADSDKVIKAMKRYYGVRKIKRPE